MIFSIIIDCFLGCIVRQTYVHFISGTAGLGCLSHELQAAGKYGALDPLLNTDSTPVFFAECVSFTSHIVRSTVILDVVACPQSRQLAASCSEALEDSETPKLNCLQITAEHAGSLHWLHCARQSDRSSWILLSASNTQRWGSMRSDGLSSLWFASNSTRGGFTCEALPDFLAVVLASGNYLNGGGACSKLYIYIFIDSFCHKPSMTCHGWDLKSFPDSLWHWVNPTAGAVGRTRNPKRSSRWIRREWDGEVARLKRYLHAFFSIPFSWILSSICD